MKKFTHSRSTASLSRPTKGRILAVIALMGPILWCSAAVKLDLPANYTFPFAQHFAIGLAVLLPTIMLVVLLYLRPFRAALLLNIFLLGVFVIWWLFIPPKNDRQWLADVMRTTTAEINGNRVTIKNLRNFDYRSETDFTENWETRTYDLSALDGIDVFFSFWGPTRISHTIVSWSFSDGKHLAISIETRKEKGEEYSAVRGFFRQFELYYVVADERDVIRLRTNYRRETVYLYQTALSASSARLLLLDYLHELNRLNNKPAWYNALTYNCTTGIRIHAKNTNLAQQLDWRILLNGYADQLAYERGLLDNSLPFAELKKHSEINSNAQAADQDPAFSKRIRDSLPNPRHSL